MLTFATTGPIILALRVTVGDVRVTAEPVDGAAVTILPRVAADEVDRAAAERTTVDFSGGRLRIETPRERTLLKKGGAITVSVKVPVGSRLVGRSDMGSLSCTGRLGDCSFKTGYGEIRVDQAGQLHLSSGYGDITVGQATGETTIKTGSGTVLVGGVHGALNLDNANGRSQVTEVTGPVRANSTNGDIVLGTAHRNVTAHSSNGSIRIDRGIRGHFDLCTAAGELNVGVSEGTRAWLNVQTKSKIGQIRNDLGAAQTWARAEADIELHAVTSSGDIVVHPA